jgi:hypothetical protein
MFILHDAWGVWIKNIYWQAHLKVCSTDVLNEVVVKIQKNSIRSKSDIFFLWRCVLKRAMASSFVGFLDHTQRRITVGMTPPDD